MDDQSIRAKEAEALQILITEHTNLQSVRSATVFEANGRTSLFLGTVSSAVVALAFIGQMSAMNNAFFLFALILLPSLIFLGLVTFIRVNQTGIEDMIASREINRIRHYYAEIAPHTKIYFMQSTHDDMLGYLKNMGGQPSIWQQFLSTAGLVGVINGVLAAVFAGLLIFVLFNAALVVCVIAGVMIFAASIVWYMWYQHHHWEGVEANLKILFPSESAQRGSREKFEAAMAKVADVEPEEKDRL
jgi:hypothetical protein